MFSIFGQEKTFEIPNLKYGTEVSIDTNGIDFQGWQAGPFGLVFRCGDRFTLLRHGQFTDLGIHSRKKNWTVGSKGVFIGRTNGVFFFEGEAERKISDLVPDNISSGSDDVVISCGDRLVHVSMSGQEKVLPYNLVGCSWDYFHDTLVVRASDNKFFTYDKMGKGRFIGKHFGDEWCACFGGILILNHGQCARLVGVDEGGVKNLCPNGNWDDFRPAQNGIVIQRDARFSVILAKV